MAQCSATAKRTGDRCLRQAGPHAPVCRKHGGGAPQVRTAAARRALEAKARKAVRGVAVEPVTNPLKALQDVAGEVVAFKDFLAGQVEVMRELSVFDSKGTEQIRATLGAYERALDRTVNALAVIAR